MRNPERSGAASPLQFLFCRSFINLEFFVYYPMIDALQYGQLVFHPQITIFDHQLVHTTKDKELGLIDM